MGGLQVEKLELLGFEPREFFDFGVFLKDIRGKDFKS
jgi:hypothetical protein